MSGFPTPGTGGAIGPAGPPGPVGPSGAPNAIAVSLVGNYATNYATAMAAAAAAGYNAVYTGATTQVVTPGTLTDGGAANFQHIFHPDALVIASTSAVAGSVFSVSGNGAIVQGGIFDGNLVANLAAGNTQTINGVHFTGNAQIANGVTTQNYNGDGILVDGALANLFLENRCVCNGYSTDAYAEVSVHIGSALGGGAAVTTIGNPLSLGYPAARGAFGVLVSPSYPATAGSVYGTYSYLTATSTGFTGVTSLASVANTTVAAASNGGTISGIAAWANPSPGVLSVAGIGGFLAGGGTVAVVTSTGVAVIEYAGTATGPAQLTGCTFISGSGTVSTGAAVVAMQFVNLPPGPNYLTQISPATASQNGVHVTNGALCWTADDSLECWNHSNDGVFVDNSAGTGPLGTIPQGNLPGTLIDGKSFYNINNGLSAGCLSDFRSRSWYSDNDGTAGFATAEQGNGTAVLLRYSIGNMKILNQGRFYGNYLPHAFAPVNVNLTVGGTIEASNAYGYNFELTGGGTNGNSEITGGKFVGRSGAQSGVAMGANVTWLPESIVLDGTAGGIQVGVAGGSNVTPAICLCNDVTLANISVMAVQVHSGAFCVLKGSATNISVGGVYNGMFQINSSNFTVTDNITAPGGVGTNLINDIAAVPQYAGGTLTAVGLGPGGILGTANIIEPIVPGVSYTLASVTTGALGATGSVTFSQAQYNYLDFQVSDIPLGQPALVWIDSSPVVPQNNLIFIEADEYSYNHSFANLITDGSGGLNQLNVVPYGVAAPAVSAGPFPALATLVIPYGINVRGSISALTSVTGSSFATLLSGADGTGFTANPTTHTADPVTWAAATASGAPTAGMWSANTVIGDATGKLWYCTAGGTPGTWSQIGGSSGSAAIVTQVNATTSGAIAAAVGDVVNTTAAATITLPSTPAIGQCVLVNRGNHSAVITITANTGQTINGGGSGGSVTMQASGAIAKAASCLCVAQSSTVWYVIASNNDAGLGVNIGAALTVGGAFSATTTSQLSGTVTMGSGLKMSRTAVSSTYSVAATDFWVAATSGTFTITLLVAAAKLWLVSNEGTGTITLTPASGTIDGLASRQLPPGGMCWISGDGTNCHSTLPAPPTTTATYAVTTATGGVQNTTGRDLLVSFVFQVTSATTGATLTFGVGPAATPAQAAFVTLPTLVGVLDNYSACARVPAGYYLALGTTGTVAVSSVSGVAT